MDTKTLIAVGLMVVIYFVFFSPAPQQPVTNTLSVEQSQRSDAEPPSINMERSAVKNNAALQQEFNQRFVLENELTKIQIDPLGRIYQVELKKYYETPDQEAPVIWDFQSTQGFNKQNIFIADRAPSWQLQEQSSSQVLLRARDGSSEATRLIQLDPNNYGLRITDEVSNTGNKSLNFSESVVLDRTFSIETQPGFWKRIFVPQSDYKKAVWYKDGSLEGEMLDALPSKQVETGSMSWTGFSSKYFFFGAVPESFLSLEFEKLSSDRIQQTFQLQTKQVPPGEKRRTEIVYYVGPKEISKLEATGSQLDRVIEYGNWIGPISRLLLSVLRFFHGLIPNYGVGIILLTILVKLILFPLAYKSAVSMKKLQIVQPRMKEIRDKYKDNPQRMNAEMMALYRNEKVNPVGGCLPLLLQMPVFFALYRVFFASIEMRHEAFFGWIRDLSHYDPFFVTPVMMTALMYFQQKLTPMPTAGAEETEAIRIQKAMFKWMPFIFGGIMLFLPSGLTLYFLVNALLSIGQQLFLNKKLAHLSPNSKPGLKIVNGSS